MGDEVPSDENVHLNVQRPFCGCSIVHSSDKILSFVKQVRQSFWRDGDHDVRSACFLLLFD